MIKNQKGQVVVLLLLVMVIALAVGLSTINRSTLEVSTSRKSEDSSRAFSAAEAGMERAIKENINNLGVTPASIPSFILDNQTSVNVAVSTEGLPILGRALAYPPFGKESFAQFWLVDPNFTGSPASSYTAGSFNIYFGDPDTAKYTPPNGNPDEKPAIEVNTIYWDGSKYMTSAKYFDSFGTGANARSIGFAPCDYSNQTIAVNDGEDATFYCRVNVTGYPVSGSSFPVMVRVRILYSSLSHPVAIMPLSGSNIPKQANIYQSSGTSGNVRRTLEVFNQKSVMPQFFDYVLFSASELLKGT